jgi:hypothetical protein
MNALAIVFLIAVSLSPAPRDGAKEQRPTDEQQQKARQIVSPTVAVKSKPGPAPKYPNTNQKPNYLRQMFAADQISQWALVGAAIVGFSFGLKSIRLLRQQVEIEARALAVTERAAGAAKDSADIAKQSLLTLERARIGVSNLKFLIAQDRRTFKYSFVMTNTGSTPADVFEMNYSWLGMPYESEEFFTKLEKPLYAGPAVKEWLTIPARQSIVTTTDDPLPFLPEDIPAIFALGYIRYRDIFGEEHITRFAYRYTGDNTPPTAVSRFGYNEAT